MIKTLRGIIQDKEMDAVVLEVAGVGYGLGVSSATLQMLPDVGQECLLYIHMAVREDALLLFGFINPEERSVFERLVSVSGIGPRTALAVLSTFSPAELSSIIINEDDKRMTAVPGIGKKSAQRIILELKGAFEKDPKLQLYYGDDEKGRQGSLIHHNLERDAQEALVAMGFSEQEIELALVGVREAAGEDLSKMLAIALRRLGGL